MSVNIPSQSNTNDIDIIDNQNSKHRRSNSIDIVSLNKTFSELNVQSNVKHEKTSIEKINEIILGSEKYFIPEKPVLKINTKATARRSVRTPASEVDFNELLKSLDDLTSEVKNNNNNENNKDNEPEPEQNNEKSVEKVEKVEKVENNTSGNI